MTKKLILEITHPDGNITKTTYLKGLKSITKDYPQIDYHQLRAIYMHHNKIKNTNYNLLIVNCIQSLKYMICQLKYN